MAGEWREVRLGEVVSINPDSIGGDWPFSHVKYIDISSVGEGAIVEPPQTLSVHEAPSRAKRLVREGDSVLSTVRPGRRSMFFVKQPQPDWVVSTGFAVLRPRREYIEPRYLYACIFDKALTEFLVKREKGAAYPAVLPEDIADAVIKLPPLPEQRAIAHILGTLDDKIELNRRMSETLEQMAQALFKAWFVDFLPVRAKMAAKANDPSLLLPQAEPGTWYVYAIECNDGSLYIGQTEDLRQRWLQHVGGKGADWTKSHPPVRVPYWEKQPSREAAVERENWLKNGYGRKWLKQEIAARTQTGDPVRAKLEGRWKRGESLPGLPAHLYDLFPDCLVDSELGEIPEEWVVGTLGEVADHRRRSARPEEIDPQTPYIALEHMPKRCISLFDWGTADGLESNKFQFKKGEILFGKLRPYFHKVGVAPVDGVCSTDIVVVIPSRPGWFGFVLGHVSSVEFVEYTDAGSTGTKMPRTSWADMARYQVVLPPEPVARAFTGLVQPLIERIITGILESRTLAALRDALLPKLLSGQVRVKGVAHA